MSLRRSWSSRSTATSIRRQTRKACLQQKLDRGSPSCAPRARCRLAHCDVRPANPMAPLSGQPASSITHGGPAALDVPTTDIVDRTCSDGMPSRHSARSSMLSPISAAIRTASPSPTPGMTHQIENRHNCHPPRIQLFSNDYVCSESFWKKDITLSKKMLRCKCTGERRRPPQIGAA